MEQDYQLLRVPQSELEGTVLNKRFKVGKLIGQGSYGKVYRVYDLDNLNLPLVMKLSPDYTILYKEIKAIGTISKHLMETTDKKSTLRRQIPNIKSHGMIIL